MFPAFTVPVPDPPDMMAALMSRPGPWGSPSGTPSRGFFAMQGCGDTQPQPSPLPVRESRSLVLRAAQHQPVVLFALCVLNTKLYNRV